MLGYLHLLFLQFLSGILVLLAAICLAAALALLSSSAPIPAIRSIVSLWTSTGDVPLKPDDEVDVDHAVVASDEGRCSTIGKRVLKVRAWGTSGICSP